MPSPPRLIPVLDIMAGRAVHAIGGDRGHYRPLRSVLHEGADPVGMALAYRDALGLRDLYLADLDAIAGAPAKVALYRELVALGLVLWVDAGVRDTSSLPPLIESGVGTIIVGLETVRGPSALAGVLAAVGPGRVAFSLDLREGRPIIAEGQDWHSDDGGAIAEAALELGVRRLVLLDLSRVGTGRGTGTLPLLKGLAAAHPDVEIAVGGGIAGRGDIAELGRAGASCVLVGSALHDGRIDPPGPCRSAGPRGRRG
jgi:phosphoribosylformimino-5-aminoimidazole carboxamide ribotide isomerase